MSRVKGLLVAALAICGMSTASYAEDSCEVNQGRQRTSLIAVYYADGDKPPDPSPAEIEELRRLKAMPGPGNQAAMLEDAFPGNEKRQAIAIRDHDGDGIKDYRITKCGEFRGNDPDVDCDGVANVLDDSPYDSVATPGSSCGREPDWHRITNDHNGNGLPDRIDWRMLHASGGDEERAAEVQEGLYRDYGIVLVGRRVPMPPAVAIELDYVIRDIFRDQVVPEFPPLRVIATDLAVCGNDSLGWTSPEDSTIYVMSDTLNLRRILRLKVLVHEITHTLQFNLDFTAGDLLGIRTRNRYDSDGFHEFAKLLDWTAVRHTPETPHPAYRLAVWHCDYDDEIDYPFTLTYLDKPGEAWKNDWTRFVRNSSAPISLNVQLKANNMFSKRGFTDAWEWDADYVAAFVLNQLLDAASRLCTPTEAAALSDRLHADIALEEWNYVNENARGLESYKTVISKQFHVDDDTWDALARHFLLGSYPGVCRQ